MSEANTEKKTRTPRPIAVEEQGKDEIGWGEVSKADTVSEAIKWIKANGKDGAVYRIITIEFQDRLTVGSKRVASFA